MACGGCSKKKRYTPNKNRKVASRVSSFKGVKENSRKCTSCGKKAVLYYQYNEETHKHDIYYKCTNVQCGAINKR